MDVGGLKRGRPEAFTNGNGSQKKFKAESESFPTGLGSKSKPCSKFFSVSGCSFGDACHFLHYVPGGVKAVSQIINLGSNPSFPPPTRNSALSQFFPEGSSPPGVKSRMCNKYNLAEGCKFGDKCHFAHGESELGNPIIPSYEDPRSIRSMPSRLGNHIEAQPPVSHGASFGAFATAKVSVDAFLAGAVIGKNGINTKQICRVTGVKLSIKDHESDPNLKNIELEGTFDQIKQASTMVSQLIINVGNALGPSTRHSTMPFSGSGSNLKTKLCEKFTKDSCTFGERCHFAHGAEELRKAKI